MRVLRGTRLERYREGKIMACGVRFSFVRGTRLSLAVVLVAVAALAGVASARACDDVTAQTQAAYQAGDVAGLKAAYAAAEATPSCSDQTLAWIGKALVTTALRTVQDDVSAGGALASHEALLRDVRTYGRDWRLETWLGDIAFDRGDFTEAAQAYQEALSTLNDEELTPTAPAMGVIEEVYNKAEMARLAADEYVGAPVTRSGDPGGLAAASFRGFQPTRRLVPVEFQFGSTMVTNKGRQALRDLRDVLVSSGTQTITLVGHTDPVGGMAANDRLSMARARAVADVLINEGYRGQIQVIGRGERDPLNWVQPLTQDQYYQTLRRVEVRQ